MNTAKQPINLQFTTIQEKTPDFIYQNLQPYVNECNTYHPQPEFLRKTIAKKFNLPSPEWIFLTNGVDEALRICLEAFGNKTHIFTPTEYTTTFQFCPSLTTHYSLANKKYQISTNRIAASTFIIIANPNNPVGYTNKNTLIELIENNPQATIAIDEVYGEYAPDLSVADQVSKYKNLIIFRGLSKSYGLAGIRIGYIIAHPEIIQNITKKTTWSNVSYISCGMAQIAFEHEAYYKQLRDTVLIRKQNTTSVLEKNGFTVIPSLINTITIKFDTDLQASDYVQKLRNNNILVNRGENEGKVGIDNSYVSFAVGTEDQMNKLLKASLAF